MSVLIPLTKGFEAIVDDEDAGAVQRYKWFARPMINKNYTIIYAYRNLPRNGGKREAMPLHRFIMNPGAGMVVDHINHDGRDNRRSNLRIATQLQNIGNRRGCSKKFDYRGVMVVKGRFYAQIQFKNVVTTSKGHDTPEDAALAWDAIAREKFGEFAYQNFPHHTASLSIAMHEDLAKGPPVCRSSVSPKTLRSETHRATDELVPAKPENLATSMPFCLTGN